MRGDVYEFPAAADRPSRHVVVVQDVHVVLPTVIVAPTTTNPVGADFWPVIEIDHVLNYVMIEQMTVIERVHLGHVVYRLRATELLAVDQRLRDVLGL